MLETIEREINCHKYRISFDDGRREKVNISEVEQTLEEETVEHFINNDAKNDFKGDDFFLYLPLRRGFMQVLCKCLDKENNKK